MTCRAWLIAANASRMQKREGGGVQRETGRVQDEKRTILAESHRVLDGGTPSYIKRSAS